MAAPTPVPISSSSVLPLGPGLDSLVGAWAASGQAKLPGHRHCPCPLKWMACCGGGPETSTAFQQDLGLKHLISPPVVWYHLDPASAWERNLGLGGAEGGGNEGRDFTISMEEGIKNKPLLTNKELNKEKRS